MQNDTPCIEERYSAANHASNLKVEAERSGPADIIIAAGMAPARLGAALIRLHSEWDGASKKRGKLSETDTRLLMGQLRSLPAVQDAVLWQAEKWVIDDAQKVVATALYWWVDHVCPACEGRGKEAIEGTPSLSKVACRVCHGSGERGLGYGQSARKIVAYLDDCAERAAHNIKARLYQMRK